MIEQSQGRGLVAMADDDPVYSGLIAEWLTMLGFEVMAFPHGDALAAWAASAAVATVPAAVLLDVEMPGSDGFATCRYLRTLPDFARVPLACVSSLDAELLARESHSAGATASLGKDGDLLPRLARWLQAS